MESKEIKKGFNTTLNFFKQKKVQGIIVGILLLLILITSSSIRLQNLPLLKDSTTGEYIPLALDPFYFLRIAETAVEVGGFNNLPEFDVMKKPFQVGFSSEILPNSVVLIWKIAKTFDKNITLRFINVISPVIFFILGLIVFFFLIFILTKSKYIAILSSLFLSLIPSYLYRTMGGFADHEAIGMFAFFCFLLIYTLALKYLDKANFENKISKLPDETWEKEKISKIKTYLFGLGVGLFSALTIACWGGISKFVFMIFPAGFFIFWLIKCKEKNTKYLLNLILFYILWIISTILFGMIFGFEFSSIMGRLLATSALMSLFVPVFMVVDYLLIKNKLKIKKIKEKYRQFYSFIIALILGIIFLIVSKENIFQMIASIWNQLLHPFGVAENAQPFLMDWMNQTGKIFFWMFIAGIIFIGIEIGKKIKSKKDKGLFIFLWTLMFSGILFSRISSSSLLNGTNFLSQVFYLISLLGFIYYVAKLYFNNKIKLSPELIVVSMWMFFMDSFLQ